MKAIDFSRSFVTFTTIGHTNNARLQIESCCTVQQPGQSPRTYYFFASCKSEDTYGLGELFYGDNYDFCGLFSKNEYAIYRTKSTHHDGFLEAGKSVDRFEDVRWHMSYGVGRELQEDEDIVRGTEAGNPLVGSVEWADGKTKYSVEFPIKTMNVNDQEMLWQVDTGPVPFPAEGGTSAAGFRPAYVAYNRHIMADFIVQNPLELEGGQSVTHYHQRIRVEAKARVFALT